MAFKYTGDAVLGVSLTVETPKPLDTRTVVNNLTELYSIPERYAYQGMTVSNIDNGNIYMLIDKSKIRYKEGWKASYESILIITCTEAEYKEWSANTDKNFNPVDESKPYLHAETYYYIYEDSIENKDLFYLSAKWGEEIEEKFKDYALNSTVTKIRTDLDKTTSTLSTLSTNLLNNYYTKVDIDDKFLTKTDAEDTYETKTVVAELRTDLETNYVTKADLKGDSTDEDFMFVTLTLYNKDKDKAAKEITTELLKATKVNINSDVTLTTENGRLVAESKLVALTEEVPKLVCLPLDDYDNLQTKEEDTYYCTYGETDINDTGYVRSEDLARRYYTKTEIDELIKAVEAGVSNITVDNDNELLIIR